MFAYCNNNPVLYWDPEGTKLEIWNILFEVHDPGFIHIAVQDHIVLNGLLFKKELYLKGVGRADIYNPETGEIWEIKHGGGTIERQYERMQNAFAQVDKYVSQCTDIALCAGDAGAFTGAFVINYADNSYLVSYYTPSAGVILYYVMQLKRYEPAAYRTCTYKQPSSSVNAVGAGAAVIVGIIAMSRLAPAVKPQSSTV